MLEIILHAPAAFYSFQFAETTHSFRTALPRKMAFEVMTLAELRAERGRTSRRLSSPIKNYTFSLLAFRSLPLSLKALSSSSF